MSDADINHTEQEQWENRKEPPLVFNGNFSTSLSIAKLAESLAKAQLEITGAVKDSTNPFFKSNYADLASVLEAMKPLHKHGLALIQMPIEDRDCVRLVTTLAHSSGEWVRATYSMRPVKNDPQGIGSCLTYMRRYAASAFCGIAQIDDDANDATHPKTIGKPGADVGKLKNTPRAGALETQTEQMQKKIKVIASKVLDLLSEGDVINAVAVIDSNSLDADAMTALADEFDAPTRKVIKDYMLARKSKSQRTADQKNQAMESLIEVAHDSLQINPNRSE